MNNIVTASFGGARTAVTRRLYQYDYGMELVFEGLDLPEVFTVHFANQQLAGDAKTQIGEGNTVTVPDEYLTTGLYVYAWVYLHTALDDGETVYMVTIPVTKRPKPIDEEPTPVQQDAIDQAIAALNVAVTGAEAAQAAAETAQEAAENAKIASESARDMAAGSAASAARDASDAYDSADEAAGHAAHALEAQAAAAGSAANAYRDAERAEQAAANAGYLDVEIVDGCLVYTRTDAVDVDFELIDGELVMEVV